MAAIILAMDLGKYKSVFGWYRESIERQAGVTVVIEACSPAGCLQDLMSREAATQQ